MLKLAHDDATELITYAGYTIKTSQRRFCAIIIKESHFYNKACHEQP
jgi:hypothetical protein